MKGLQALKRIRQETCPATYMQDFDKEEWDVDDMDEYEDDGPVNGGGA